MTSSTAAAVVKTGRLLALIEAAAKEGGYFHNWASPWVATRLKGRRAHVNSGSDFGFGPTARYDEDTYTETTTIAWAELTATPPRDHPPTERAAAARPPRRAALPEGTEQPCTVAAGHFAGTSVRG
ncbi:hypothetical protein AB0892_08405 [Streptomyces sp. NPDC005409]|uniref:hypothetical protein n=1 Tax=Streptomyces sp. NPDC005409 TaxID=3155342 RepID=UPI0034545F87